VTPSLRFSTPRPATTDSIEPAGPTDPDYRGKVEIIRSTLSRLEHDEAFFSIDEFGPFAVKMRAGRSLSGSHQVRVVPQWQKSKGSLIVTAALELSKNRISHFYSQKKNTIETHRR